MTTTTNQKNRNALFLFLLFCFLLINHTGKPLSLSFFLFRSLSHFPYSLSPFSTEAFFRTKLTVASTGTVFVSNRQNMALLFATTPLQSQSVDVSVTFFFFFFFFFFLLIDFCFLLFSSLLPQWISLPSPCSKLTFLSPLLLLFRWPRRFAHVFGVFVLFIRSFVLENNR
jgi:hypothetical protein